MQKGPHGLEGVTGASNEITTFRLADPQFVGKSDSGLQLTLFSAENQEITFSVTSEKLIKYSCVKEAAEPDNWTKLSFNPDDFKSAYGVLPSWQDVLTFEVKSPDTVLINSLLWV
jgi:hypothetical protein